MLNYNFEHGCKIDISMTPLEKGKLYTPNPWRPAFRTGGQVAIGYHDNKVHIFKPEDRLLYLRSEDMPNFRTGTSPDSPCHKKHIFLYGETLFVELLDDQLEGWICIDEMLTV